MNKFSLAINMDRQNKNTTKTIVEGISDAQKKTMIQALEKQSKLLLSEDIDSNEQQKILTQIQEFENVLASDDSTSHDILLKKYGIQDVLLFMENRLQGYGGNGGNIQLYKLRYCLEKNGIHVTNYSSKMQFDIIRNLLRDMYTNNKEFDEKRMKILKSIHLTEFMVIEIMKIAHRQENEGGRENEKNAYILYNILFALEKLHIKYSESLYIHMRNERKKEYQFLKKVYEYGYNLEAIIHLKKMKNIADTFLGKKTEYFKWIEQEKKKYPNHLIQQVFL